MNKYTRREKKFAEKYKGQRQPGSGSGSRITSKDDIRVQGKMRIELKSPTKSYTLKYSELDKLYLHALRCGEMPVFLINFPKRNYVLLTEDDFIELKEKAWNE